MLVAESNSSTSLAIEQLKRNIEGADIVSLDGSTPGLLITYNNRVIRITFGKIEKVNPGEIDLILSDTQRQQSYVIYILEVTEDILSNVLEDVSLIIKDYKDGNFRIANKGFLFFRQQTLELENPSIVHRVASKTKKYIDPRKRTA